MLPPILLVLLVSTVSAQFTVRERFQSGSQSPQTQNVAAPPRITQPFIGRDSLIQPLPVVQEQQQALDRQSLAQQTQRGSSVSQQNLGQNQQTVRQQQGDRDRLASLLREQDIRRRQELQRRQEAQRQQEIRRRQEENQRLEVIRQRQAIEREQQRQRQQEAERRQEIQRQETESLRRQELVRQREAERRRLQNNNIPTLDDVRDGPFQDGTYYFGFATGNGIVREEGTRLTGPYTHQVTGSYSYTAPNGEVITMEYIADENGYRAYRVRPGQVSPIIPPSRILETPPLRPVTPGPSPLENRPFNRPRPNTFRPPSRPNFGNTQRPQNFNTQRPQNFNAQRPQNINVQRPQNFNAQRPQNFNPVPPRPQTFSPVTPQPQTFNALPQPSFSPSSQQSLNFNTQNLQQPPTFSPSLPPLNNFNNPGTPLTQTFNNNAFANRVGVEDLSPVADDDYGYGGALTQAVLGAQPPTRLGDILDI